VDFARGGVAAIAKKIYMMEGGDWECSCARCTAAKVMVHSPPLITISTSLYKAISTLQKTMFVESHGYPQGLKPKERDVAAAVLVEKRAYIHPPDAPIVPAAGAAAGSPLAQSPKRAARSGGWGSTTLGEELAPSMFKSPAKLPMSETRAARSGRKSSEGAMTTPQEGAFSLPPLPFDLAEYFPDFGARGRWAHRHFERYMYALDLIVEHRVFRYPSYKSHADKAFGARASKMTKATRWPCQCCAQPTGTCSNP